MLFRSAITLASGSRIGRSQPYWKGDTEPHSPGTKFRIYATGALGFTSYQKCSAAIRMLSYGMPADIFDEYLRMGETTCLESMYRFAEPLLPVKTFSSHLKILFQTCWSLI